MKVTPIKALDFTFDSEEVQTIIKFKELLDNIIQEMAKNGGDCIGSEEGTTFERYQLGMMIDEIENLLDCDKLYI